MANQTIEDFQRLEPHIKAEIQKIADMAGSAVTSVDWGPYRDLEPPPAEDWASKLSQAWAKTFEQRRNRQQPKPELPTEAEARSMARRLGVLPEHIWTQEQQKELDNERQSQADREALHQRLNDAIANRDVVELEQIGNGPASAARDRARETMSEVLPSFDYWRD